MLVSGWSWHSFHGRWLQTQEATPQLQGTPQCWENCHQAGQNSELLCILFQFFKYFFKLSWIIVIILILFYAVQYFFVTQCESLSVWFHNIHLNKRKIKLNKYGKEYHNRNFFFLTFCRKCCVRTFFLPAYKKLLLLLYVFHIIFPCYLLAFYEKNAIFFRTRPNLWPTQSVLVWAMEQKKTSSIISSK